jgi:hypothetical protein
MDTSDHDPEAGTGTTASAATDASPPEPVVVVAPGTSLEEDPPDGTDELYVPL